ncbi:DET1 homolog [Clavelina lepadiformis]|uniref:DET1 homolog n=1 Tax=Clavelina lepadiformis TaxID=159417 RepID=UPI004041801A
MSDFSNLSSHSNFKEVEFHCRTVSNQNLVHKLNRRETTAPKHGSQWVSMRAFYQCIIPNFTVVDVEKPPFFLRKFSPDGRHFIVFSADQTSVEVYEFKGCQAAENLLSSVTGEIFHENLKQSTHYKKFQQHVREKLFSKFFVLKYKIPVANEAQNLNRECSLFTDDGRYVLVVSAAITTVPTPDSQTGINYDIYSNNEALNPNPRYPLEDYALHSVNILNGTLRCSVPFKCDKIFLSHNQGLYLFKNVLAVLSVQHQNIYVFHVKEGNLVLMRSIGRFCFEDDRHTINAIQSRELDAVIIKPFHEKTFNSLKHRLLTFLYKQAANESKESLCRFFQRFSFLEDLRMWRMQLLDEDHVLIKYATSDVVSLRIPEPSAQPSFFVVYNLRDSKIIGAYENTSIKFLKIFEKNPGLFRGADVVRGQLQAACSDIYSSQIQQRFKETIINAKYGGHTEAVKRLLGQIPVPSQTHSPSPYLDLVLFSYDDKWISPVERPKASGDYPIRFYSRKSGMLRFQIRAGMLPGNGNRSSARKLVAFTFHPHEPFAMSVQRINTDYVLNFHFRHVVSGDG